MWKCESEIGIISADWSVKKQAAGKTILRAALLEFLDPVPEVVVKSEVVFGKKEAETIAIQHFEPTATCDIVMSGQTGSARAEKYAPMIYIVSRTV